MRNQFDQLLLDRLQSARKRTLELLRRDFRLIQRLRIDQVAHRLGLRQVDAPVEKGAHGELAGLGQASTRSHAQFDDVPQHNRRSMGGDFDHVVGRVGMWLGKEGDDDFVDALRSEADVLWTSECSSPKTARPGSSSCFSRSIGSAIVRACWPGQPHHADSAAPRRSRDRDNRVVEIHAPIVTGKLVSADAAVGSFNLLASSDD